MFRSRLLVFFGVLLVLAAVAVVRFSPGEAGAVEDRGGSPRITRAHAGKSTLDPSPSRRDRPTGRPLEESRELQVFESFFAEWQNPAQRITEDLDEALSEAIGALSAEEAGWYAQRWMTTEFRAAQRTYLLEAMFARWIDGELAEATRTAYHRWRVEPGGAFLTSLLDAGLRRAVKEDPDLVREIYLTHYGDPPRAVEPHEELPALDPVRTAAQR